MLSFIAPLSLLFNMNNFFHINEVITVENISLSTSYYKEYLGFKLVNCQYNNGLMVSAIMRFGDKLIRFEKQQKADKHQTINELTINLKYNNLKMLKMYESMQNKVLVVEKICLNKNGICSFSVKDCNDIKIKYIGHSDKA